jgi:photosystem II stability/assembly factor-like uncharacterized protein
MDISSITMNGESLFALSGKNIYRSTNNGAHWGLVGTIRTVPNSWVHSITTIKSVLFAATQNGIYQSIDNGTNWTSIAGIKNGSANLNIITIATSGQTLIAGTGYGNGFGGVLRSVDSGRTWEFSCTGLINTHIRSFAKIGTILFTGTAGGGIYRSIDDGERWTSANSGLTTDTVLSLVVKGTTIFAGTYSLGGGVYSSTDNGQNWQLVGTYASGLLNSRIWALEIIGTAVVAGTDRGIYRSIDDGITWMQVGTDNSGLVNGRIWSLATNDSLIFAGTDYTVYRSADKGLHWEAVGTTDINQSQAKVPRISTLMVEKATVYAGTLFNGIYQSLDNGVSWRNIGFANNGVYSLAISGNTLFAVTDLGIFQSTNNGKNWNLIGLYGVGLKNNRGAISLSIKNEKIFAGTAGNGVFRASLSGTTAVQGQPATSLALTQYPNPFTTQTTLEYDLPTPQHVRLALYSPLGQLLMTLVDEWQQAGRHSFSADMSSFASDVYVARLQAGAATQTALLRLVR